MSQAMKARLALLKATAAAGGEKLAAINAWKSWAAAKNMDVCDLMSWALEHLSEMNDEPLDSHDGKTVKQLITEGMGAPKHSLLDQALQNADETDAAGHIWPFLAPNRRKWPTSAVLRAHIDPLDRQTEYISDLYMI